MSVTADRTGRDAKIGIADTGVGVLDRAVAILEAVEAGARTLAAVVRATALSRTTAHRLLTSLEAHRFLEREGGRGYRLGSRLLRLATSSLREIPLRDVAHRSLERLAEVTGESAQLYVASAGSRVCVDSVQSTSELRTIVDVGAELPMTAGSAGKVFMAWMPEPGRQAMVRRAKKVTEQTPVAEDLERELLLVRRRGWASSAGERQPGVGSVSAPIFGAKDFLLGTVSISGPTSRIGRISAKRYAPAVVAAAREIERALGTSI
ncbi:MAG: IclR family transcriptional regulator [Actinobacteria bacterium]|nr:IclR family transcriptional regulator [Actinomycetota bacterium]